MFGFKTNQKLDLILEKVEGLKAQVKELKLIRVEDRKQIMSLTAELTQIKNKGIVKKVKKPRKKSLRKASGWTKVTPEEAQSFVDDYAKGLSILEIANLSGRSSSTVGNWIHKLTDGVENENNPDPK